MTKKNRPGSKFYKVLQELVGWERFSNKPANVKPPNSKQSTEVLVTAHLQTSTEIVSLALSMGD